MKQHAYLLTGILLLSGIVGNLGEEGLTCYDGPFEHVTLDGCGEEDCKSFETLNEAESFCSNDEQCGGITKSAYGDEEAINLGVGLYEARQVCLQFNSYTGTNTPTHSHAGTH